MIWPLNWKSLRERLIKFVLPATRLRHTIDATLRYDIYENGQPVSDPIRRMQIINRSNKIWEDFDKEMAEMTAKMEKEMKHAFRSGSGRGGRL